MLDRIMLQAQAPPAATPAGGEQRFAIVLQPLSHPELGEIRIDENLFAVGRGEAPFVSYAPPIVADLSRRHARIFSEYGAVYLADLDSKNGTSVNRANVRQKITRLRDGDEICFGKSLSYRVQLRAVTGVPARASKLVSLTLTPERGDLGLQPIVVTRFPFLISKSEDAFARYKEGYPNQVNYLSRRHAHIFLKGGLPYVEDLGSTNGTFVGGERLQERAALLEEGAALGFGGHHFVYRVSLQKEDAPTEFTVTRLGQTVPKSTPADADKTTFVAVAGSFLDIFCVDQPKPAAGQSDARDAPEADAPAGVKQARPGRRGERIFSLLAELRNAFSGGESAGSRRSSRWAGALAALLAIAALAAYFSGSPEREVRDLISSGEYARAAAAAGAGLANDPDNPELRTLGTEALLKGHLPGWIALLKAREFERASAALGAMKKLAGRNSDAQPLLAELEWIGKLEQFYAARGAAEPALRGPADEEAIKRMLRQWEDDAAVHQRAFATISSHVPEFKDTYAAALSHLRKMALAAS